MARGGAHAHHARGSILAQIDMVEVEGEYALLVEAQLQVQREGGLRELAPEGAARGEEEVLGQLLRDGAGPLQLAAAQVGEHRAGHRARVEAVVGPEALVLGGDDGVAQGRRDLLPGGGLPALGFLAGELDDELGLEAELAHRTAQAVEQVPLALVRAAQEVDALMLLGARDAVAAQGEGQLGRGPAVFALDRRLRRAPVAEAVEALDQALGLAAGGVLDDERRRPDARGEAHAQAADDEGGQLALGLGREPQRAEGRQAEEGGRRPKPGGTEGSPSPRHQARNGRRGRRSASGPASASRPWRSRATSGPRSCRRRRSGARSRS